MVREDRARGVDITFEIRLSGTGGGVWTVRIADGECAVRSGFAERADVRYTADARVWCGLALGLADGSDLYKRGLITKEGGREAMDHYFHQVTRTSPGESDRPPKRMLRDRCNPKEQHVISFKLEEEQEIVRDAMRDFAAEAMRPIARDCDEASAIPDDFLAQTWELGLVSTQIPEAYGGAGEARSPITNACCWRSWPGATRRSPSPRWRRPASPTRSWTREPRSRSRSTCRCLCGDRYRGRHRSR